MCLLPKVKTIVYATAILLVTLALVAYPEQAYKASIHGLYTWGEIVFPSLLPFFIASELLIRFGVIQFAGVLFEPIMRPLFNVSGTGSIAWLLGMVSGYPTGAKICASLRKKNLLTQIEAERLVSFSNAASPLFIFGAIAVGLFTQKELGFLIALCHYMSNTLIGICMRFYRSDEKQQLPMHKKRTLRQRFIFALQKMHRFRLKQNEPFGEILADAVISSVKTLVMIGGFIILFSVLTSLLQSLQIARIVEAICTPLFSILFIPVEAIFPTFSGLFEISIGAEKIATLQSTPLYIQIALISFILGFNGFSIQAQVASILAKTDIRFYPYFIARLFHGLLAFSLTLLLYRFVFKDDTVSQHAFITTSSTTFVTIHESFISIGLFITLLTIICTSLLILYRFISTRS